MEKILFLSHTDENGDLSSIALEALTAASETAAGLGAELTVGLFGGTVTEALRRIDGRVLIVEGAEFGVSRYATDIAAAEALVKAGEATIVIAPGDSRTLRSFAGLAARFNAKVDTHVTGIETAGGLRVSRWFYRQRMQAQLSRTARPWFIAVEGGVFRPYEAKGSADVRRLSLDPPSTRTQVVEVRAAQSGTQTIKPDAKLLFVAGAGWTKKQKDGNVHVDEAAELILDFLKKADASLGSSKSLVDLQGEGQVLPFMSHLNQVGQTGSTPRHPKGLATCCHGEEPHVVGWRFINERRAINLDANCGWAQGKADVLYVADAFEVMREVNRLLG